MLLLLLIILKVKLMILKMFFLFFFCSMTKTWSWALLAIVGLCAIIHTHAEDQLSWSGSWSVPGHDSMLSKRNADADAEPKQGEEDVQGRNYAVNEPIYSNDTDINQIIDQIINSRREGRILNEYDRVYEDGNVDQALMQGDDMQARNLVRDKLCALGLMSCEEAKRPYYSSIYAQGPPKYGGGPYGAPKPMPPPSYFSRPHMGPPPSSINSFGPPRKVGYETSYKPGYRPSGPGPNYNGPYLESPPPSAIDGSSHGPTTFNRPPPGAVIYGSKPPGPVYTGNGASSPPYAFETPEKIQVAGSQQTNFYSHQSSASAASSSTKVVVSGGLPSTAAVSSNAAGLQQHVHHHYHHVEGGESAKVPTVPIPVGAGQTINTDFSALAQSSTAFTPQIQGSFENSAFTAGFNGASQGGLLTQGASGFGASGVNGFGASGVNGFKPNPDLYSKPSGGLSSLGGIASSSSNFGQSGFGQSGSFGQSSSPSASYHSQNPDYYKKELHNIGGIAASSNSNFNSLTSGYGSEQFNGAYDTARNQFVDCQCVPFNQCPAADRIGRKEDLILPIDPRNLGKDIEALSDETAANVTISVTAEKKSDDDKKSDDKSEDKKRSKRETGQNDENNSDDAASDLPLDAQGVSIFD